ncbi:MAG: HAD family phosphatase [Lachnospiraceae bacterium]|nr:HAD family phosphatase [Lachnospiraceae bacterium]
MIRNIIFDIGNVLIDFCWREHIRRKGFQGETAERIGKAMMQSPVWDELDRGVWTNEELLQGFIANDPELEKEIRIVFSDLGTLVKEKEGSSDWIRSLKADGYQVYYLSNYSERVKREAASELSFLKEMDGGIMSCTVQTIKPDPRIYQMLMERYELLAEESVFLDDTEANVAAAGRLGMYGILVKDVERAKQELAELLKENGLQRLKQENV